jgi:hypothetical protein
VYAVYRSSLLSVQWVPARPLVVGWLAQGVEQPSVATPPTRRKSVGAPGLHAYTTASCRWRESDTTESGGGWHGTTTYQVRYEGSATLWSMATLASRRAIVTNEYPAMVITAFLRASGFTASSYTVRWTDTFTEESWVIA